MDVAVCTPLQGAGDVRWISWEGIVLTTQRDEQLHPLQVRAASALDQAAIATFLERHRDASLFLLADLANQGTSRVVLALSGPEVVGVMSLSSGGILLIQAPSAAPALVRHGLGADQNLRAVIGPTSQVDRVLSALYAPRVAFRSDEILYALDLAHTPLPMLAEPLWARVATPDDRHLIARFRLGFRRDALGGDASPATVAAADADAEVMCASGDTHLLLDGGVPVSMAQINARHKSTVQIGGVYTPDAHRRRGYGRMIVAAMLEHTQIREAVTRAVLFTARSNTPAQRAYQALGFQPAGDFTLAFLEA